MKTRSHFAFSPPLVAAAATTGTFDATQSPVVTICHLSADACDATVASFATGDKDAPNGTITVDAASQQYSVLWSAKDSHLAEGQAYRLAVSVAGTQLGSIDYMAEHDDGEAVDQSRYLPLVVDRTLPVKFRIEQGAVYVVDPAAPATVQSVDGSVTIAVPANATESPLGVTIDPAPVDLSQPANAEVVGGSTVELGPEGTTFDTPVTLTLRYDPSNLPKGMDEQALRLATLVNGQWQQVKGSAVDPVTHTVTGQTPHFSTYGVVAFPATFVQLAIGDAAGIGAFVCGLDPNNDVYCWGEDANSALGAPATSVCGPKSRPCILQPELVQGGVKFKSIAAGGGGGHVCGIALSGDAYCWGSPGAGQLGDGTNTVLSTPTLVAGGHTWTSLAAGEGETCGIATDGNAYCWGSNAFGQIGTTDAISTCGTASCALTPVQVAAPTRLVEVSVGLSFACGVGADGSAWCWGSALQPGGSLGDGSTTHSLTPVRVAGSVAFKHIAAGTLSACAVSVDDAAYCWGRNEGTRTLGIGTGPDSPVPVPVAGGLSVDSISAANTNNVFPHICMHATDGNLWCFGDNSSQQLGSTASNETCSVTNFANKLFTSPCNNVPVLVGGGHTFRSVVTGSELSCGVSTDDRSYCWGNDLFGQIGDGTTSSNRSPSITVTQLP